MTRTHSPGAGSAVRSISRSIGALATRALARSSASLAGHSAASRYRRRAVVLLFSVLAADWADRSLVGGMAPTLKHAFGMSNTEFGALAAAFGIVSAVATLPMGALVDRAPRRTLLAIAVALWSLAVGFTGAAVTFTMLAAGRLALGIMSAAAGPAIPSLTGDLVPAGGRGRVLGLIGSGQLVGTGIGFLLSAAAVSTVGWRSAFWLLALPGFGLAVVLRRLPEPERTDAGGATAESARDDFQIVPDVAPDPRLVIDSDQSCCSMWQATRYVLRVRTNVIAIIGSSVGNFFLGGVGTFGVLYVYEHYHLSKATAALFVPVLGVGAIGGMLLGGRLGDLLQRRGVLAGRIYVAVAGYVATGLLVWPAILTRSLWLGALTTTLAIGTLQATQPALDAVRLDVIHPQLRGRAEGIRTLARTAAEAGAPLLFGVLADNLAGGGEPGLRAAFLVTLPALLVTAGVLLLAVRTYPREVAAACASSRGAEPLDPYDGPDRVPSGAIAAQQALA